PTKVPTLKPQRADALTGGREDSLEPRRRRDRNSRPPDAAPEIAARHDDDLDFGHLIDPHHVVAVKIGLLDCTAIDRAFAVERCGEAVDKRAGNLALDLRRVDRVARVGGRDDAVDLETALRAD